MEKKEQEICMKQFEINDSFWSYYQKLVREVVIPYQENILRDQVQGAAPSHAIENFRIAAGESQGSFYGAVFQDSDVAKWLEAVAYSLQLQPDPELEKRADEVIRLIEKAQCEDGYLNTYFSLHDIKKRWTDLQECHELYCAGHMIEAAVAYYECTGKKELLEVARKLADHIDSWFGPEKHQGIPGHEEIELALFRLYRLSGEPRYRDLAEYFLEERGKRPDFFIEEKKNRGWSMFPDIPEMGADIFDNPCYNQNHLPIRRQTEAVGHAVRAMYLYTAMADLAIERRDSEVLAACQRIWKNVTGKRMYLTGGIGSTGYGEAFTADYDLPNDMAYCETCASVGLIFWARKMLQIHPSAEYADVMERALYNVIPAGIQRDGKAFFYVNPLEVVAGISGKQKEYRHVLPKRFQWHDCACCPPNLARLVASLSRYAWGEGKDTLYNHLFLGGDFSTRHWGGVRIKVKSAYPWEGSVEYHILPLHKGAEFTLAIHIPAGCGHVGLTLNGTEVRLSEQMAEKGIRLEIREGYWYITRKWEEDILRLNLELPIRTIHANPSVREDAGKVAFMRGPIVYCMEDEDQEGEAALWQYCVSGGEIYSQKKMHPVLGDFVELQIPGFVQTGGKGLYLDQPAEYKPVKIKVIPYYLWGNRNSGSMQVWIRERY